MKNMEKKKRKENTLDELKGILSSKLKFYLKSLDNKVTLKWDYFAKSISKDSILSNDSYKNILNINYKKIVPCIKNCTRTYCHKTDNCNISFLIPKWVINLCSQYILFEVLNCMSHVW